jgi:hypothetical protein
LRKPDLSGPAYRAATLQGALSLSRSSISLAGRV